jgi:hypothetical protein
MTPRNTERMAAAGCRGLGRWSIAALVVAAVLPARAADVSACGNAVNPVLIKRIRDVAAAADALGAGRPAVAAAIALAAYPTLHATEGLLGEAPGWDAMGVRAQRVVAVSVVRTEGLLESGVDFHATTLDERRANLQWAIGILRAVVNVTGAPEAQTDLGEALSKLPETRDEARSVLERLDADDLVTSAQAYAALAELREAAGDLDGRDRARKRFEAQKSVPELVRGNAAGMSVARGG